jgi:hypothetical protein
MCPLRSAHVRGLGLGSFRLRRQSGWQESSPLALPVWQLCPSTLLCDLLAFQSLGAMLRPFPSPLPLYYSLTDLTLRPLSDRKQGPLCIPPRPSLGEIPMGMKESPIVDHSWNYCPSVMALSARPSSGTIVPIVTNGFTNLGAHDSPFSPTQPSCAQAHTRQVLSFFSRRGARIQPALSLLSLDYCSSRFRSVSIFFVVVLYAIHAYPSPPYTLVTTVVCATGCIS